MKLRALLLAATLTLSPAALASAQSAPLPLASQDGRTVYLGACAGCHGGDGTGLDRALVAFEEGLPDFTDCSFASREPDADWVIVAHEGGPVRGFSEMMPAFGDALGEDALLRAVQHIRTFCQDDAWPRGELNLPRALVTEKAYPEDEWVLENEAALEGHAALEHTLIYEKRFGARSQLELAVPFLYRRDVPTPQRASWTGGVGDVAVGVKHALLHGLDEGRILSAVAEVKLPTGDESRGFGSGDFTFEGFLAFGQILPSDAFLQFQAGAERVARSEADTELFWTGVVGRSYAQGTWGRTWTPMLEVWGRLEDDETEWDILPQLHVTLNTRQHVMLTLGPRIPIGDDERNAAFMINLLWDWFDGGFRDGW